MFDKLIRFLRSKIFKYTYPFNCFVYICICFLCRMEILEPIPYLWTE
ncbi:Uncharacterised protein [Pantoea agglomerans]|uniref:Uncharacterized protein n=1 Tax=Enterobacter agglomerans TaxID=549 RepID=A0A379ABP8_ENTAG|nr:Uncharacterised protein [Pantoea agglomerans]